MDYEGIKLEMPAGKVSLSHSHAMDMIMGKSGDQNTNWLDALAQVPWGPVHDSYKDHFDYASKIFSLVSMDYQVCNGGIDQYFFNGYHEEREPFSDNDVERVGIEAQKGFLYDVLSFAKSVFPERAEENNALEQLYDAYARHHISRLGRKTLGK